LEGRKKMRGKQAALATAVVLGVALVIYGVYIGAIIGADWYGKDATFLWHMNNYIVMEAQYAYSIFGLATMVIGGLTTGVAISVFFIVHKTSKLAVALMATFFIAIITSGLGFNTLDFMLGCFYWTNQVYPPPVQVGVFFVDVWNFYFFLFLVPLWLGGFLVGSASAYFSFIHKPRYNATAYIAEKKFSGVIQQQRLSKSEEHLATRKLFRKNFDNTN
jgi:hypothetical protein